MINIIAVNIKQGGGLTLLKLLITKLINQKQKATIHVDQNIDFKEYKLNNIVELKYYNNFLSKLFLFGKSIPNALYFGNIPPFFTKAKNKTLYYHHPYYTKTYKYLFKKGYYKYICFKIYIFFFIKNVDKVFVQTNSILESFNEEFEVVPELMPFFDDLSIYANNKKSKIYDFSYISLPNPNKNFNFFLDSLVILNTKLNRKIKIVLTIPNDNFTLIKKIKNLDNSNIEIINLGKISKEKVIEVLNSTETLIFPSLIETFGLPLVEACQLGAFVICSDLPYTYDVIIPSAVFDPYSKEDIANTMFMSLETRLNKPKIIIENKIEEIIKKLIE